MPQVEFEPTIPVFEPAKTVHALDLAATVIGSKNRILLKSDSTIINTFNRHCDKSCCNCCVIFRVLAAMIMKIIVFGIQRRVTHALSP
jgi:hypothetical protein